MKLTPLEMLAAGWMACASLWAFLLFGFDKWRAGKPGAQRTSESTLGWTCALGGWPGGFLGLLIFRHKSAKPSFLVKFFFALLVWAGISAAVLKLSGRI